jgi:hypothetical protein
MKPLITLIFAAAFATTSVANEWDNPKKPFNAEKNRTSNTLEIEWRISDNVQQTCNAMSKEYGNGGFNEPKLDACAFWWNDRCIIVTKKRPTMHDVGHEIRHCFYGQWH